MRTRRVERIRGKVAEGYYDRPEIIAAAVSDLTNVLLGRQHARETQLRWMRMNPGDVREERHLAGETAGWRRGKGEEYQNRQSGHLRTA